MRSSFLKSLAVLPLLAMVVPPAMAQGLPKLAEKPTYKVGFSQTEMNNPWRLAQTQSMKDEAAKLGWQLVFTDAASSAAKQVADVDSMIAQRVDVIFLSPREEKALIPAVMKAKRAGIPVFLIDRDVDESIAKPGRDFVSFIGSDFVLEGHRAGDWMVKATNGQAKIIELQGTLGSSPANDRRKGFAEAIAGHPGMQIVASQTGDFTRDGGRRTMETLLQAHPEATAVYAHNDEMAMGAIAALEAAGRHPGKDITIVSIDGEKDGLQAVADGKMGATVECNPRFGPAAYAAAIAYSKGQAIPPHVVNKDNFYDSSNAAANVAASY